MGTQKLLYAFVFSVLIINAGAEMELETEAEPEPSAINADGVVAETYNEDTQPIQIIPRASEVDSVAANVEDAVEAVEKQIALDSEDSTLNQEDKRSNPEPTTTQGISSAPALPQSVPAKHGKSLWAQVKSTADALNVSHCPTMDDFYKGSIHTVSGLKEAKGVTKDIHVLIDSVASTFHSITGCIERLVADLRIAAKLPSKNKHHKDKEGLNSKKPLVLTPEDIASKKKPTVLSPADLINKKKPQVLSPADLINQKKQVVVTPEKVDLDAKPKREVEASAEATSAQPSVQVEQDV
ncbi:Guanine-nucleotide exchange factor YEL1 [Orchesella cincta]|uniref:Guanine-nucleotide exchange factor YEL1 n=1 Tax=Orchesella cincta TaxID=48709 RepID=A0A1D2MB32_ORCCI|nr:Guanine-nucleotide exchange factor YEL1 [Orchesella cincta]